MAEPITTEVNAGNKKIEEERSQRGKELIIIKLFEFWKKDPDKFISEQDLIKELPDEKNGGYSKERYIQILNSISTKHRNNDMQSDDICSDTFIRKRGRVSKGKRSNIEYQFKPISVFNKYIKKIGNKYYYHYITENTFVNIFKNKKNYTEGTIYSINDSSEKYYYVDNSSAEEIHLNNKEKVFDMTKEDSVKKVSSWPEEDYIKYKTCEYLDSQEYDILYIAWGHSKGTDIIAGRYDNNEGFSYLFIEAKGGAELKTIKNNNLVNNDTVTPEGNDYETAIGQICTGIDLRHKNIRYYLSFPIRRNDQLHSENNDVYGLRWDKLFLKSPAFIDNIVGCALGNLDVTAEFKEKAKERVLELFNLRAIFVDSDGQIRITDYGDNNNKLYLPNGTLIDTVKQRNN